MKRKEYYSFYFGGRDERCPPGNLPAKTDYLAGYHTARFLHDYALPYFDFGPQGFWEDTPALRASFRPIWAEFVNRLNSQLASLAWKRGVSDALGVPFPTVRRVVGNEPWSADAIDADNWVDFELGKNGLDIQREFYS